MLPKTRSEAIAQKQVSQRLRQPAETYQYQYLNIKKAAISIAETPVPGQKN
ncbi:MAG TPA: hypothetical protein ACQGQI_04615 [Xylella sp.]